MIINLRKALLASAVCILAAAVAGARGTAHSPRKEGADLAPGAGRDALRETIQKECLTNWRAHHDPAPCERIVLEGAQPDSPGYAVIEAPKGGAHYLLVPVQTLAGADSGELLDPDLPNFFAEAWGARDLLSKYVGHAVPRTAIGLVLNTAREREQNQFHLHLECLRQEVAETLHAAAASVTGKWAPVSVSGSTYQAMRIADPTLDAINPFELVAKLSMDAKHHLENYTMLVAGMQYSDGAGFVILTGTGPTAELLLDPGCTVAGGGG
jgi:CDP-diacylglycerol pyrophosphatase